MTGKHENKILRRKHEVRAQSSLVQKLMRVFGRRSKAIYLKALIPHLVRRDWVIYFVVLQDIDGIVESSTATIFERPHDLHGVSGFSFFLYLHNNSWIKRINNAQLCNNNNNIKLKLYRNYKENNFKRKFKNKIEKSKKEK